MKCRRVLKPKFIFHLRWRFVQVGILFQVSAIPDENSIDADARGWGDCVWVFFNPSSILTPYLISGCSQRTGAALNTPIWCTSGSNSPPRPSTYQSVARSSSHLFLVDLSFISVAAGWEKHWHLTVTSNFQSVTSKVGRGWGNGIVLLPPAWHFYTDYLTLRRIQEIRVHNLFRFLKITF